MNWDINNYPDQHEECRLQIDRLKAEIAQLNQILDDKCEWNKQEQDLRKHHEESAERWKARFEAARAVAIYWAYELNDKADSIENTTSFIDKEIESRLKERSE